MTVDQGLALLGIGLGVLGLVLGPKIFKRWRQSQRQIVRDGSTGVQSGRDINISSGRDTEL
jgi:hypothetical protein